MANSKVALLRRVRIDAGWRYYPVAYSPNGKVKPEVVIVAGKEVKHQTGYYALRYYQGTKIILEPLKDASSAEAEAKRKVKEARLSALVVASKAGIDIKAPDPNRRTLAAELGRFLSATEDRGSIKVRGSISSGL